MSYERNRCRERQKQFCECVSNGTKGRKERNNFVRMSYKINKKKERKNQFCKDESQRKRKRRKERSNVTMKKDIKIYLGNEYDTG